MKSIPFTTTASNQKLSDEQLAIYNSIKRSAEEYIEKSGLNARYEFWLKMPFWNEQEAQTILVGLDPNVLNIADLPGHVREEINARLTEIKAVMERAIGCEIDSQSRPAEYIQWAKKKKFSLAQPLLDFLDSIEQQTSLIEASIQRSLQRKPNTIKELNSKERQSALKLVLGMAIAGYRYDVNASRSSVVSEITHDLHSLGISMDEDTVRKWLNEAKQTVEIKQ